MSYDYTAGPRFILSFHLENQGHFQSNFQTVYQKTVILIIRGSYYTVVAGVCLVPLIK